MEMINISIIVPVYNTSQYLDRCIKSLINQTQKIFEIIIINDASTDDSLSICRKYADKYDNIKIYNLKNNIGLGAVRNYGVKLAKGEYIAFVDSDDYVHSNMYSILVNLSKYNKSDITMCKYETVFDNEKIVDNHIEEKNSKYRILTNHKIMLKEYLLLKIDTFAWNKVFRRKFWIENNLMFAQGCYYEDINAIAKALNLCNKIVISDYKLYRYVQRDNSIMHTYSDKHLNDYYEQISEFYKYISTNYTIKEMAIEYRASKFRLTYNILNMAQNSLKQDLFKKNFEALPNEIVIFGASEAGRLIQSYCNYFNKKILYFIDNNKAKVNKYINGVKIIDSKCLENNSLISKPIFIASMYYAEIYLQLKKYKLDNNVVDLDIF